MCRYQRPCCECWRILKFTNFDIDLRLNQWSQLVPVGDALIGCTSVQIVAMPKLMKLPAAGGSDVVRIGSTVVGTKAFDDFDN